MNEPAYKIDLVELERQLQPLGLDVEKLKQFRVYDAIMQGQKSPGLVPITLHTAHGTINSSARLSLVETSEGEIKLRTNLYRPQPQLDEPYFGYQFDDNEKQALLKYGNLGKVVPLTLNGAQTLAFVSLDRVTNEIIGFRAQDFECPQQIYGVKLTEEQKGMLWQGKSVLIKNMVRNGSKFSAEIQVNAADRYLECKKTSLRKMENAELPENSPQKLHVPQKVGNYELSPTEKNKLRNGEILYIQEVVDKKGTKRSIYLKPDLQSGEVKVFDFSGSLGRVKTDLKPDYVLGSKEKEKANRKNGRKL